MQTKYDIIIIGGGPAGTTVARYAAETGVSVLLLEKDRDIGYPVRCGEAIGKAGMEPFLHYDPAWVKADIKNFALIAPNGDSASVLYPNGAYILERRVFDYELGKIAAEKGAEILTRAYVDGLLFDNGSVAGVSFEYRGEKKTAKAKVVIAADGVESRAGRWAGLTTHTDFRNMESCYQYTVGNIDIDQETCYFYFGSAVAPYGYLWIFPKGNRSANIGVGINGLNGKTRSAVSYLDEFMSKEYPSASILTSVAGGVPCTITLKKISGPGILLAGDAAHQVNPLSGGGIASGMVGGMIAGQVAARSVKEKNPNVLFSYDNEWREQLGKKHEIYDRLKEGTYRFSDEMFNSLAATINKIPYEQRTMRKIFTAALINKPLLLLDIAKVFL